MPAFYSHCVGFYRQSHKQQNADMNIILAHSSDAMKKKIFKKCRHTVSSHITTRRHVVEISSLSANTNMRRRKKYAACTF